MVRREREERDPERTIARESGKMEERDREKTHETYPNITEIDERVLEEF